MRKEEEGGRREGGKRKEGREGGRREGENESSQLKPATPGSLHGGSTALS